MKIAIIASGWHFPSQFYEKMIEQKLPENWSMDLFCVAHRDPKYAKQEKKGRKFSGQRAYLDEKLYRKILSKNEIKKLGWNYIEEPNTIGDWGNANQWLEKHNYKEYDLLLITHDDNLILTDTMFRDIINDESFKEWEILCNSLGMPEGNIRGSFEFFKPTVIEKLGEKFDLGEVSLTREGVNTSSEDLSELYNWNVMSDTMMKFVRDNNILVGYLSNAYRVSAFCIEGERGYISNTHGANTEREDYGLNVINKMGLI